MTARTSAHLELLATAYGEHVRALRAHLGLTAAVNLRDGRDSDDLLPGPPMEYALRALLERGLVIDAYERVQWGDERSTTAAVGRPDGLFAPRGEGRPGYWCVEVKRWVPVTTNDSLADRNARAAGLPTLPVEIHLQLERLCCAESRDRSPEGLVFAVTTGLEIATAAA